MANNKDYRCKRCNYSHHVNLGCIRNTTNPNIEIQQLNPGRQNDVQGQQTFLPPPSGGAFAINKEEVKKKKKLPFSPRGLYAHQIAISPFRGPLSPGGVYSHQLANSLSGDAFAINKEDEDKKKKKQSFSPRGLWAKITFLVASKSGEEGGEPKSVEVFLHELLTNCNIANCKVLKGHLSIQFRVVNGNYYMLYYQYKEQHKFHDCYQFQRLSPKGKTDFVLS